MNMQRSSAWKAVEKAKLYIGTTVPTYSKTGSEQKCTGTSFKCTGTPYSKTGSSKCVPVHHLSVPVHPVGFWENEV